MAGGERIDTRFAAGTVVDGRYEIVRHIGEGGFASVFLAKQTLIDRFVAIKILHNRGGAEATMANFEDRFILEAQVAAKIKHGNVVTIHDFGFTGAAREPYLVMEYLSGHSLEEEIREVGPLPAQRVLPMFVTVLDALAEGHRQGVVHKDLKPANLHVCDPRTDREKMKVLDFGVARLLEVEGSKMTSTGQMFGTPQYMAPEYIERNTVTPALDVYQLGLILAEALTGTCVVDEDTAYLCCVTHCRGDLELPQSILDSPLGPVLANAVALDYTERYQDAGVFRDALMAVDPASVVVDPRDTRSRKISAVSGSQRSVATANAPSDTGQHEAKHTRPGYADLGFQATVGADIPSGEDSSALERPRRSVLPLVAIAVVLLALVVSAIGVILLLTSHPEPKQSVVATDTARHESAETTDEASPEAEVVTPEVAKAVEEGGENDEVVEPPDEGAENAEIEITSDPPGARVYQGRRKLGTTPMTLPAPTETTQLTLKKRGFVSNTLEVRPDSEGSLVSQLVAKSNTSKPQPVPAAPKTEPTKTTAPPNKGGFDFADDKKPTKTDRKKSGGGMTFAE